MAERTALVFGQGLDRESGVLAARQGSMDDLRNVVTRRGKVQVRKGVEEKVTFTDTNDQPVTHILAGQALKGDKTGIVVAYQNDSGAADYGKVLVYLVPGDASSVTFLDTWFTISDPANQDIPVVITTEVYGKVFLADNRLNRGNRADTMYYDSLGPNELQTLTADFDGDGTEEAIQFRGVTKHLDYLVGWGYGLPSGSDAIRPELVRTSLPAEPTRFRAEHYSIAGNRNDPIATCVPAAQGLVVFKETEFYLLQGTGARNFGLRISDERYGCAGPRLAVSVAGRIYFWSNQGPRVTGGGPSQDLALPLALNEFEPDDLATKGADSEAWAAYIPSERVVVFFFDQRGYILHVRRPQQLRWSYWELPFTPECAFQLYEGETIDTTVPQGRPEWLRNGDGASTGEVQPIWKNNNPRQIDAVDIYIRPAPQLMDDLAWPMGEDEDGDGVVDGWTKFEAGGHTVAFALENDAQKIDVTGSTAAADSGVERVIDGIEAGKDYTFGPELDTDGFTGGAEAFMELEWRESDDTPISTVTAGGWSGLSDFERRYEYDATAPANAAKVRVRLLVRTAASGEVGTAWFRLFMAVKVEDQKDWRREDVVGVNPNDGSEQEEILDGFASAQFMEIALRYRNGTEVTAGYEGDDPDQWPDESKGVAVTPIPGITAEFEFWFYGETSLGSTGHGLHFNLSYEEGVKQDMKDAAADGQSVGVEVYRKRPGVAGETEFTLHETLTGTPDEYEDASLGEDTSDESEEDFEYKFRTFIGSEKSGFSDVLTQWPGPCRLPDPWDVFVSDDTGGAGIVTIAWENHDSDLDIWGFDYWCSVDNATDRVAADNIIERRNVTDGASFSFHDSEPCGTESHDDDVSGEAQGDTLEYRFRHRVKVTDDVFFGPYTEPQQVTVP